MTRTSVDVSYFRRVYGNFRVTDNRVLGPADFDKFDVIGAVGLRGCRTAAATRDGMYNLNPAKFGLPSDNLVTHSQTTTATRSSTGTASTSTSPCAAFRASPLQGGTSTGRTVTRTTAISGRRCRSRPRSAPRPASSPGRQRDGAEPTATRRRTG